MAQWKNFLLHSKALRMDHKHPHHTRHGGINHKLNARSNREKESRDRKIPRSHWLFSIAKRVRSRFSERPSSGKEG